MKYTIPMEPIAWKRTRVNKNKFFDVQKELKKDYALFLIRQHIGLPQYTAPLDLKITFFMPIPLSLSQTKKKKMEDTSHHSRPDLDNLIKFLLDASTGVLWLDDAIVTSLSAKKVYAEKSRTEMIITEGK